ncbi:glycoside hydrolase family 128 protein [Xylaria sp. CBS 124048]|nr:glycoside hydrolase family 128 protein [Xylaria sp. CBS 124048]
MSSLSLTLLTLTLLPALTTAQIRSPKRGLIFIPNPQTPDDNTIWTSSGSDLTWYYNYSPTPSAILTNATASQAELEFVPMLFGSLDDTSFLDTVTDLIDNQGMNITHILTFNEPDGPTASGGSNLSPEKAAQIWVDNIVPLQAARTAGADRLRIGLPACTGGQGGIPWLMDFLGNCSALVRGTAGEEEGEEEEKKEEGKTCTYDFVPIHWYGDFQGLASRMGEYSAAFPNTSQWITEYALPDADLASTQDFYNTSADYLDRLDSVERYSYFGSFRSDVSNVGPNAAMLNNEGRLTDIGSWYLGGVATGVEPQSGGGGVGVGVGVGRRRGVWGVVGVGVMVALLAI